MIIVGSVCATPLLMCNISMVVSNKLRVRTRCCRERESYGTNQTNDEQRGDGYGSNPTSVQVSCSDLKRTFLSGDRDTIFLVDMKTLKFMQAYIRIYNLEDYLSALSIY